MLLRLKVQGFKNLRDIDVRFGPLTCFVGRNGVGKSNIFDAIQFLRFLSDREIQQAAEAVRSPTVGVLGPLDLFSDIDRTTTMRLVADLLVPRTVIDDFGEEAEPSTNLLRYAISFRYAHEPRPRLELLEEELIPRKKSDARKILGFPHTPRFRESAVKGSARKGLFISTSKKDDGRKEIMLHQDGGSRGRPVNPGNPPGQSSAPPTPRTIRPCSPRAAKCRVGTPCSWSHLRCAHRIDSDRSSMCRNMVRTSRRPCCDLLGKGMEVASTRRLPTGCPSSCRRQGACVLMRIRHGNS